MGSRQSSFTSGRHTNTGEGLPIISPFPANSLTTASFQWLHTETWNDEEIDFFLANRQLLQTSAHAPVPPCGRPTRTLAAVAGRWLLRSGELVSSVEVQGFHNRYHRFHLLLGAHPNHWQGEDEALALFATGIIMMGHADRLTIVPPDCESERHISQVTWGKVATLWVPYPKVEQRGSGRTVTVLHIEPEDFWETEMGSKCRETLRYLERRVARTDPSCGCDAKKPRMKRGFFSRFFRSGH